MALPQIILFVATANIAGNELGPLPDSWAKPSGKSWIILENRDSRIGGVGHTQDELGSLSERSLQIFTSTSTQAEPSKRRRLLYTLFSVLDQKHAWSSRHEWQQINGWVGYLSAYSNPLPHAQNVRRPDYLIHNETWTARHDFASFMSWYLTTPDADDGDSLYCQYLSHARFADQIILEVDALSNPRLSNLEAVCPDYVKWARWDDIESFEINYATPLTSSPSSLFGHLSLRIIYDPLRFDPIAQSTAVSFAAETGGIAEDSLAYSLGGIFGYFRVRLNEQPFSMTYERYLMHEARDLLRWKLVLSEQEKRRLMERIWTIQRANEYDYYFFQTNCSTLLIDLLNSILPTNRQIVQNGVLGRGPSKALDQLFFTPAHGGRGSILSYIPRPLLSAQTSAKRSKEKLNELVRELTRKLDTTKARTLLGIQQDEEALRIQSFKALPQTLAPLFYSHSLEIHHLLLYLSVIESYRNNRANHLESDARKQEYFRRLAQHNQKFTEEIHSLIRYRESTQALKLRADLEQLNRATGKELHRIFERLSAFIEKSKPDDKRLSKRLRQVALLRMYFSGHRLPPDSKLYQNLFLPSPHKPISEQAYLGVLAENLEGFRVARISDAIFALQQSKFEIVSQLRDKGPHPKLGLDSLFYGNDETAERQRYERAHSHGPIDNWGFSAGFTFEAQASPYSLVINASIYDEALGSSSRHGYRGDKALTVLKNESWWTLKEGLPYLSRGQLRILGFRALTTQGLSSQTPNLGWEWYADYERRPWTGTDDRSTLGAGIIGRLFGSAPFLNHVFITSGLQFDTRKDGIEALLHPGLSTPLGLETRLSISQQNFHDYFSLQGQLLPHLRFRDGVFMINWQARAQFIYSLAEGLEFWGGERRGLAIDMSLMAHTASLDGLSGRPEILGRLGLVVQ